MKRFIIALLIANIIGINSAPVLAYSFNKKSNVIQTQVSEYKFQNVNLDWWKDYKDEYLQGYIIKAINENQDLKNATLRVEEARQMVKVQFASELPSFSAGVSPAVIKNMGVTNTEGMFAIPMVVSYEADIFLKNHDKTKSVKKQYEAAKYNEKAVYIAVASQIGATYFNIVKMDKLISIQESIINDRKQIYELMRLRNEQGITSTADEVRAQKAYVMAVADLTDLKKARDIMLNSLAVMIGENPNNVANLKRCTFEELINTGSVPKEISSEIIVQRPDYLIAEKNVEKAGLDVTIAKKEFLPKFDILGLLVLATSSATNSLNWTNALAAFGGAAMLPLFTGGKLKANLKLKKNKYEQVLNNYYKTNLVAIQEVNDALGSLKLDNEKYLHNLNSYAMQKKDYNYMQSRYNQGIISKLDLLQQKEALLVMDKMVVASKTDCYIGQISLYKAVGGNL